MMKLLLAVLALTIVSLYDLRRRHADR